MFTEVFPAKNRNSEWVHDRFEDGRNSRRPRDPRDRPIDRYSSDRREDSRTSTRLRIENLHYNITESDLNELFSRIGPVESVQILYDRSDRSRGIAFVTYADPRDAHDAVREYHNANAYGQPIYLTPMPTGPTAASGGGRGASGGGRDPPVGGRAGPAPPRSLFDRIDDRDVPSRSRRSESPGARRRALAEAVPEGLDRYVPGQRTSTTRMRSPLRRGGGRRPGVRREDSGRDGARRGGSRRDDDGHLIVQGRPRKTAEELDAEMTDYFAGGEGGAADVGANGNGTGTEAAVDATGNAAADGDVAVEVDGDIDMIE